MRLSISKSLVARQCAQGKVQNSLVKFLFETKQNSYWKHSLRQILGVRMQIELIFLVLC